MNNGVVDTERLSHERRVRYLHRMFPRGEAVSLVQKCLWDEVILGTVKGGGFAIVNLDRIGTIPWPNCPVDLHGGTCMIVREVFVTCTRVSITLKPSVG